MGDVLALDQGTTSSRAIVFDRTGGVVATAQQEFRQIFPKPGRVEYCGRTRARRRGPGISRSAPSWVDD